MKVVIVIALIGVLAALAGAGVFMLRRPHDDPHGKRPDARMAWALALRVALSIALFVLILVSWKLGWISPHGIPTGR